MTPPKFNAEYRVGVVTPERRLLADLMTEVVCTCSQFGQPEKLPGRGAHAGMSDGGTRCGTAAAAAKLAARLYEPEIRRMETRISEMQQMVDEAGC